MSMPVALDQSSSIIERALHLRERMRLSLASHAFVSPENDETRLDWSKIDTSGGEDGEKGHNCTTVPRGNRQR